MNNRPAIILATFLAGTSLHSAPITWATPQQIGDALEVSTNGTLVRAFNLRGADTTVNTVFFQAFTTPSFTGGAATDGNFTLTSGFFGGAEDTSSANQPFTDLDLSYREMLGTGLSVLGSVTLTMGGLTNGLDYEFQMWVNQSADLTQYYSTGAGLSSPDVSLSFNTTGTNGGLGEYLRGTFTADASAQQVMFFAGEVGMINGFQVRQVPEPSIALFGLALLGAAVLIRRQR